jgi:phenylalanyl-tRNA synthetase beta chain
LRADVVRISWNWLSEYVSLDDLTPQQVANALTMAGLEVDDIETLGGSFSGVLAGQIITVDSHPNADRLRLVRVNLGSYGQPQVVCGAPNVAPGMYVAFAPVGASVVNRKEGGMWTLKPAKIRGVESTGMICAIDELGLEGQFPAPESGIWPIDAYVSEADPGRDLKDVLGLVPDTVLVATPNANRGDLMSMRGVAREVAALFNRELTLTSPDKLTPNQTESPFTVKLKHLDRCSAYYGGTLCNVHVGPSPDWLCRRLTAAGIRSINNVVDITNYVMLEYGQPLHAFDADKLQQYGTEIGVRLAQPDETLACLDDVTRTLTPDTVVVTCNDMPVALAGVMGGADTAITNETNNVFLESAYFLPKSTRRSALSVGIRTESSARFERGADPVACYAACAHAIKLLLDLTGAHLQAIIKEGGETYARWGTSYSKATDTVTARSSQDSQSRAKISAADSRFGIHVPLRMERIQEILGISISQPDVTKILATLGIAIVEETEDSEAFLLQAGMTTDDLVLFIPSFRQHDVTQEIDLIEEIIRIYGYDKIPATMPPETATPAHTPRSRFLATLRRNLTRTGLSEVMTHSLIGDSLLERMGCTQEAQTTVRVTNSQSIDHTMLRQSLLPNLLDRVVYNQAQGNEVIWLFEPGRVYLKTDQAPKKTTGVTEQLMLSGLITGHPLSENWHQPNQTDYFTLKGLLEQLLSNLGLLAFAQWEPLTTHPMFHPGQSATLFWNQTGIGVLGRLHPQRQAALKLKQPVYLFELDADILYSIWERNAKERTLSQLSPYPAVTRDIAFSVPDTVSHQQLLTTMKQTNQTLIQEITLFDEYRGESLAMETRSLAYRVTLQSPDTTLTEAVIDSTMAHLREQLQSELPVVFR